MGDSSGELHTRLLVRSIQQPSKREQERDAVSKLQARQVEYESRGSPKHLVRERRSPSRGTRARRRLGFVAPSAACRGEGEVEPWKPLGGAKNFHRPVHHKAKRTKGKFVLPDAFFAGKRVAAAHTVSFQVSKVVSAHSASTQVSLVAAPSFTLPTLDKDEDDTFCNRRSDSIPARLSTHARRAGWGPSPYLVYLEGLWPRVWLCGDLLRCGVLPPIPFFSCASQYMHRTARDTDTTRLHSFLCAQVTAVTGLEGRLCGVSRGCGAGSVLSAGCTTNLLPSSLLL
ncbi:hypothetical protein V8E36_003526 [Tilletia maclaganii]